MPLTESTVEEAALKWFGELGYGIGHGPEMAPGEAAASATCKRSLQVQSE
jgi:type I restriction enzyme R subunit